MTRDGTVETFAGFPDRFARAARVAATQPIADGEWGPSEIARHLIAVEREVWWTRFASIVEEDEPHWAWTEPGLEPGLDAVPLSEVLERFAAARARSVAILDGYDDAAWARTGVHATYGRLDALGLLRIVSDHDAEHLASLSEGSSSLHSEEVTDDPHQFRLGDQPTPFSADEIRQGCPPGRTVRTLVVRAGQDPYVHVARFLTGDEDGGDQEFWDETPDGTRLTETETGHSAWRELQGHASMPADRTTVTEEEIQIPAGRFACLRYTRTDENGVGIFWFARSAPGMPLKFEQQVEGKTVFSSTTLSDERPA